MMVVYLGTDFATAHKILSGHWSRTPTFLYRNIDHAARKARKNTEDGHMPVVIELHYNNPRKLQYNPHKCGYHTSLKPQRARIKWIGVNGGFITFNY
ncbi:hypothetical protein ACOKWN_003799 [Vibrio parahaemolyticus]